MSEITPTATPEVAAESAPTPSVTDTTPDYAEGSTESFAADALADLEGESPDGLDGSKDPSFEESTPVIAAPEATTPTLNETEAFYKEFGLKPRIDGREHRIPESRVREMVAKKLQKAQADFEAKVAEHTTKAQQLEARLQEVDAIGQLMETNPEQFIQLLAQASPAYARYAAAKAEGATPSAPRTPIDSMPQPDVPLPDGTSTYSVAGLQKLLDWQAQETEKRVAARYAHVEQTVGQWQMALQQQAITQQANMKGYQVLQDARTWPGFNENERDILKVLQSDPKTSLERAYRQVVLPKLQADRNKLREEVLKEIQTRPTSTAAPTTPAASGSKSRVRSTEEVAREMLAKLGG